MNGANCSSSCHISRAKTKPLLTWKTMSLCKSQRPTETSPQPRTATAGQGPPSPQPGPGLGRGAQPLPSTPRPALGALGSRGAPCSPHCPGRACPCPWWWQRWPCPLLAVPSAVSPARAGASHPACKRLSKVFKASHRRLTVTTARKMKSAINYSLTKETRRGKKGRRKACEEGILNTN